MLISIPNLLLTSFKDASIVGKFQRTYLDQKPAVLTPSIPHFSFFLCLAKYARRRVSSPCWVKSLYSEWPKETTCFLSFPTCSKIKLFTCTSRFSYIKFHLLYIYNGKNLSKIANAILDCFRSLPESYSDSDSECDLTKFLNSRPAPTLEDIKLTPIPSESGYVSDYENSSYTKSDDSEQPLLEKTDSATTLCNLIVDELCNPILNYRKQRSYYDNL